MTKSLLRVLLIEDNEDDAALILAGLKKANGFEILMDIVATEKDMRSVLRRKAFDIILCDHYLSASFDSDVVLKVLTEFDLDIPVILVSGILNEKLIEEKLQSGIYEFVHKDKLFPRLIRIIKREILLASTYNVILQTLVQALEYKQVEAKDHSERVAEMSVKLARQCGLDEIDITHLRRGSLLHDVGKIGIPDAILLKPGKLSEGERVQMQHHPQYAYDLMKHVPFLKRALDIPYCHHEHWDGSGYPRGLKGEEIPLSARIFSVIDNWDALTSERAYRVEGAWPREKTLEYIQEQVGKLFDPDVVKVFVENFEKIVL
jgi:response regulator RpfG family c-di-GMP phosphodiesterase